MATDGRAAGAPPSISEALRATVSPGGGASADVRAAVEAAGGDPPGEERFWAASVLLLGLPDGPAAGGRGPLAEADALLTRAIESEEVLQGCPDCAALWGFARLHGLVAPAPPASMVAELARGSGLAPVAAAYALAAGQGGPLGRLAWGRLCAGEAAAVQDIGGLLDPEMPLAWPRPQEEAADGGGLSEALEMAMAVASSAIAHEHTPVPQPVELDHLQRSREEDRVSYALAEQLAASGDAGGLAAKAEMLFYGKESVVPGAGTLPAASPSAVGFRVAGAALLAVAIAAPCAARCVASRCRGGRRRSPRASDAPEPSGDAGRSAGLLMSLAQAALCVAACLLLYSSGPLLAPPGALSRDEALSLQLFSEAADGGHWGAAYALLLAAADGDNRSEAAPWLEQVVEQGDAPARAFAAHFQSRWGVGSERDPLRAGELLWEAAELGEPNAALLLAEAHAHGGGNESEVRFEGGPNLSVALQYYRRAAEVGLSTCRFNIGAILMQQAGYDGGRVPVHVLREARAEFVAVATDLDPTVRLLFALGVRSWELGHGAAALRAFMLLSEVGSDKAHRNAALLWERRAADGRGFPWWPPVASLLSKAGLWSESAPESAVEGEPLGGPPRAPECGADAEPEAETFQLAHRGRYCCAGGDCHGARWLLNEGGVDPVDCVRRCRDAPSCSYATVYDTGFCQLSEECEVTAEAGDLSAATYALTRRPGSPQCGAPDETAAEAAADVLPAPTASWCWPPGRGRPDDDLRCAVAYHVRAAPRRLEAALAAARRLEGLGLPGAAHAWSCAVAGQPGGEQGRIRCAALEAEAWDGHPGNLTLAVARLSAMAQPGADAPVRLAASLALARVGARFLLDAVGSCRLAASGLDCSRVEAVVAEWGAPPVTRALPLLAGLLLAAAVFAASLCRALACRALARRGARDSRGRRHPVPGAPREQQAGDACAGSGDAAEVAHFFIGEEASGLEAEDGDQADPDSIWESDELWTKAGSSQEPFPNEPL